MVAPTDCSQNARTERYGRLKFQKGQLQGLAEDILQKNLRIHGGDVLGQNHPGSAGQADVQNVLLTDLPADMLCVIGIVKHQNVRFALVGRGAAGVQASVCGIGAVAGADGHADHMDGIQEIIQFGSCQAHGGILGAVVDKNHFPVIAAVAAHHLQKLSFGSKQIFVERHGVWAIDIAQSNQIHIGMMKENIQNISGGSCGFGQVTRGKKHAVCPGVAQKVVEKGGQGKRGGISAAFLNE